MNDDPTFGGWVKQLNLGGLTIMMCTTCAALIADPQKHYNYAHRAEAHFRYQLERERRIYGDNG